MKNVTMSERVAMDLLETIRGERMEPGDRLPTENELSDRYGVSRSVVREATRALVARGIVEVGSGRGLTVAAVGGDLAAEQLTLYLEGRFGGGYASVHEVRAALEVQAARLAAERAGAEDVAVLEAAHVEMGEAPADEIETMSRLDIEFHRRIARATGNEFFVVLLDAIAPTLTVPRVRNLVTAEGRKEALEDHGAILAAIAAHDPDLAAAAMRDHLDKVISRLSAGDGDGLDVDELANPEVP